MMMTRMVMKILMMTIRSIFPVEPVIETAPKSVLEVLDDLTEIQTV